MVKNRGSVILLSMAAALCVFACGIFIGRNYTGGKLLFSRPLSVPATVPAAPEPEELIDLNTATSSQLQSIPGIGPVIAGRIIAYREAHGPFTSLSQLCDVEGVGLKIMEAVFECATVGG